jgi:hypothetical protein
MTRPGSIFSCVTPRRRSTTDSHSRSTFLLRRRMAAGGMIIAYPACIGFTANSLGHMATVRDWYLGKGDQGDWAQRLAMMTIAEAAVTEAGQATSLIDLDNGLPLKPLACPFSDSARLPDRIKKRTGPRIRASCTQITRSEGNSFSLTKCPLYGRGRG